MSFLYWGLSPDTVESSVKQGKSILFPYATHLNYPQSHTFSSNSGFIAPKNEFPLLDNF